MEPLRNRYIALFGPEPSDECEVAAIEKVLDIRLPNDFREVSTFYSGGILGGISHNAIAARGPATNITDETRRLRDCIDLPHRFVVLAEPAESLIVLDSSGRSDHPAVVWCDASDVTRLGCFLEMHDPHCWTSYAEFFGFLLDEEEAERLSQ